MVFGAPKAALEPQKPIALPPSGNSVPAPAPADAQTFDPMLCLELQREMRQALQAYGAVRLEEACREREFMKQQLLQCERAASRTNTRSQPKNAPSMKKSVNYNINGAWYGNADTALLAQSIQQAFSYE